jgi:hypothetical protein
MLTLKGQQVVNRISRKHYGTRCNGNNIKDGSDDGAVDLEEIWRIVAEYKERARVRAWKSMASWRAKWSAGIQKNATQERLHAKHPVANEEDKTREEEAGGRGQAELGGNEGVGGGEEEEELRRHADAGPATAATKMQEQQEDEKEDEQLHQSLLVQKY